MITIGRGALRRPGSLKPPPTKLSTVLSIIGFLLSLLPIVLAGMLIASNPQSGADRISIAFSSLGICLVNLLTIVIALFMALRLPVPAARWLAGLGSVLLIGAAVLFLNDQTGTKGNYIFSAWVTVLGALMILAASLWTWWYLIQRRGEKDLITGPGGQHRE